MSKTKQKVIHGSVVRAAAALLAAPVALSLPAIALAQDMQPAPPSPAEPAPAEPAPEVIQSITVAGNQRLEPDTIRSYIRLRVGQPYSQAAADQALKDLYATELLSDAQIRNEAGNVTVTVKENPVVNRIILEGNKRIKDDKILPEIKLAARQIFTRSKVRADVARIIELYKRQGRFAAVVEPKMVQLEQNRVDIVYEISEGDKSKVRQINIIGNDRFSDGKLRGEMVTKQARMTRFFSSSTSYDPDRMAFDQQKLRQFYLTQGYADFRVVSAVAELTPDKRDFIVTYVVEEGDRYKFGEVSVESQLRDFDGEFLTKLLPMKAGDWYDAKQVEDTIEKLNNTASAAGYAFADVRPEYIRNKGELSMGVRFNIAEAPRVYVEKIDVNGNTLTQDKVVRREFRIAEGDAFSSQQVLRSTNRIKSLGYFQEKLEVEQKPGSAPDRIALEANVEEKPTGELQLSAGFSSIESFIFQASVQQRNFRGRGQTVGVSGSYSRYSKSAELNFVEPYIFDKNVSLGINLYRRDYNSFNFANNNRNDTYQQSTTGFQLRTGIPLTEYLTAIASYTFNYDQVSLGSEYLTDRVTPGTQQCDPLIAGRYLCDALGNRLSSILGLSLIHETLDNRQHPTRGHVASISLDGAGLGGSVKYARLSGRAAKYWSAGGGFIFSVAAEGGMIRALGNGEVRLTDRFYLGEPQMRGFDIRGVGPRVLRKPYVDHDEDALTADIPSTSRKDWTDDALGGRLYYQARAELEIPLGSGAREMGLRPSVFLDAGAVWGVKSPIDKTDPTYTKIKGVESVDVPALYQQINAVDANCLATSTSIVTNETNASAPACLGTVSNSLIAFRAREEFLGNSWKPRVAVGVGVNWNSPFGPFRIDFSRVLLKQSGDDTKPFSFNVGTQF